MIISKPKSNEYNPYYEAYIGLIEEGDLLVFLSRQVDRGIDLLSNFEDHPDLAYEHGKWTVKELLQHIIDTERIFATRALRIARGDKTPQPGFDQDLYAANVDLASRTLEDVTAEFVAVRGSTFALLRGLNGASLELTGTASDSPVSVRALFYMICGHAEHHLNILRDRYVPALDG